MTVIIVIAVWFGIGEIIARKAIDLKYYASDGEVGYYLLPNQRGGSMFVGSYAVNEEGMGVAESFKLSDKFDVLLVGDSIVLGSSQVDQPERLGPQLEAISGWEVWPLSAGSWSLWNELRMIARKPQLRGVDATVFVVNARDFDRPSFWRSELAHPRSEPDSYLLYALLKKARGLPTGDRPVPVRQSNLQADWRAFRRSFEGPVYVIGYNGRATAGSNCEWLPKWLDVPTACFDPAEMGQRSTLIDAMHLDAQGNRDLAGFVKEFLSKQTVEANSQQP